MNRILALLVAQEAPAGRRPPPAPVLRPCPGGFLLGHYLLMAIPPD